MLAAAPPSPRAASRRFGTVQRRRAAQPQQRRHRGQRKQPQRVGQRRLRNAHADRIVQRVGSDHHRIGQSEPHRRRLIGVTAAARQQHHAAADRRYADPGGNRQRLAEQQPCGEQRQHRRDAAHQRIGERHAAMRIGLGDQDEIQPVQQRGCEQVRPGSRWRHRQERQNRHGDHRAAAQQQRGFAATIAAGADRDIPPGVQGRRQKHGGHHRRGQQRHASGSPAS